MARSLTVSPAAKAEEFYLGYQARAPKGLAAFTLKVIVALFALLALSALLFIMAQHGFPASVFEFFELRSFDGFVSVRPYPTLLVVRPGKNATSVFSRYYLVEQGKHGAEERVAEWEGRLVRLKGKLIYRDHQTMIEISSEAITPLPVSAQPASPGADPAQSWALGTFTLDGEIVDSKCYLGVMNPGNLKTHRGCAVRCLSGGTPPIFVVRDAQGNAVDLLLVSSEGRRVNQQVLEMVAEPLRINGKVSRHGDLLILAADPETYRRLGEGE
jgi:hypothetical protein